MGLATQKGRKLRTQQKLRKQAKPVYLQSQDETWQTHTWKHSKIYAHNDIKAYLTVHDKFHPNYIISDLNRNVLLKPFLLILFLK